MSQDVVRGHRHGSAVIVMVAHLEVPRARTSQSMAGARLAEQRQAVRREIVVSASIAQIIANCEAGVTGELSRNSTTSFCSSAWRAMKARRKNVARRKNIWGSRAGNPRK